MVSTLGARGAKNRSAAETQFDTAWRFGPAHYLAVVGAVLVAYQAWTLGAWLLSDPHVVTKGRDAGSFSWWWARGIEVVAVVIATTMLVSAIRESRRIGRMAFDLKLWIALLLTSFWDTVVNFFQPLWFYSTNFVNLNEWWGHAPGFPSTAAGYEPFPVIALVFLYPCFVLEARIAGRIWSSIQRRIPGISNAKLMLVGLIPALAMGSVISMVFVLPHLWAGPGMGAMIIDTSTYRWSIAEFLYVGVWSITICALRFFVDDDGLRITERGLDRLSPMKRNVVSTLATTAWCTLAVIVYSSGVALTGFHATSYPTDYPEHLPNVVCSIPGDPQTAGSHYGPCPGSPGFRMPIRGTAS
ncbi:MAG: spirocyclase AveC family protein [Mycobacterium sp.]|nr:spirocyclase AveC family protein [Mycobacterium sp.]